MDERTELPLPRHCPYCGGTNVTWDMAEWRCVSVEDPGNAARLQEHQCMDCDGRSFWT